MFLIQGLMFKNHVNNRFLGFFFHYQAELILVQNSSGIPKSWLSLKSSSGLLNMIA